MIRRLGLLTAATAVLWVLLAYPAYRLGWPNAVGQSAAAMLICLVPAGITLLISHRALARSPDAQLTAMLGGMGLRMIAVIGVAILFHVAVPGMESPWFWGWIIVFYLCTLALELGLLLRDRPS